MAVVILMILTQIQEARGLQALMDEDFSYYM